MRSLRRLMSFVVGPALLVLQTSALSAQEADTAAPPAEGASEPASAEGSTETPAAAAAPKPATPDEATPATSTEPGKNREEPRFKDANADRVILFSTAETHPEGTFFFTDHELILLQFGYAFTDEIQLSLSGVPPLVKNQPYFFDLAFKAALLRTEVFRLALIGAATIVILPDEDPGSFLGARGNAVGQFCFEALCRHSFSLNVGTFVNSESNTFVPITLAGGTVIQASDLVKFLVEPAYALAVGEGVESQPEGFLLNYGIRLSGRQFGFDIAFLRPFFGEDIPLIMGFPWVAFTYRTASD
jgi:hypothetical protein